MIRTLLILLITVNSTLAIANSKNEIRAIIDRIDPHVNLGISIKNLTKNKLIFEQNANRNYTFASSIKIITLTTLGKYFGFDRKFGVKIYQKENDFYITIDDPSFKIQDLSNMLNELKSKTNAQINNFYIVNQKFTLPKIAWEKNYADTLRCFGAAIERTHFNKNCTWLKAKSGKIGHPALISKNEFSPYQIINNTKTINNYKMDRLETKITDDKFIVDGTLASRPDALPIAATVEDGAKHLALSLRKMLQDKKFTVKGNIIITCNAPKGSILIEKTNSFKQLARVALVNSDNFITDYLLAQYATEQKYSHWEEAAKSLQDLAARYYGANIKEARIMDGAGLSRRNAMTVKDFAHFLDKLSQDKNFPTIKTLMHINPKLGTFKKRNFRSHFIFAKTGHLTGINSLTGYFIDKNNDLHSFVIVINNYLGPDKKYDTLQEAIVNSFF